MQSLPEVYKIVQLAEPKTTNAQITSDVITLKNAIKAWIIVHLTQAAAHATTISLRQATSAAAGTNAAGPTSRIWADEDVATSDALVEQTAAASYTVTADIKNKVVVIEVDPAALTDGYPWVYVTVAASSESTNFAAIEALILSNYQKATPPTAIA